MLSLYDGFVEWARNKPADETYDYCDRGNCAFAQYLKYAGVTDTPYVTFDTWSPKVHSGVAHDLPGWLMTALVAHDGEPMHQQSYGELAERLDLYRRTYA